METQNLLHKLRAYIVWQAFGECRSPGWEGAPPSAREAVDAIDAALSEPTEVHQPLREELYRVAINCPHSIDRDKVVLHFDPKQPGHNALNQLARRLDAAFTVKESQ